MKFLGDGSVIMDGVNTPPSYGSSKPYNEQYGAMRCRIVERLSIDDPRNTTSKSAYPQLEYNCLVLDGSNQGQIIYNVIDSTNTGGAGNYTETVRTADSQFQPTQQAGKDYRKGDGDFVLVSYVQGQINTPIIIGGYKHPQAPSSATTDAGIFSKTVFNNIVQEVGKDGGIKTTNLPSPGFVESLATSTMSDLTTQVNDLKTTIDDINAQYAALPDIDLSDDIATMESLKTSADAMVADLVGAPGEVINEAQNTITGMLDGLSTFKDLPLDVGSFKGVSSAVGSLGSLVGFSKPVSFELTKDGACQMGNSLQKFLVDKCGQSSIESLGGTGQKFALGGVMNTVSPIQNISALGAFNVDSVLTKIGKACKPASRLGDLVLVPTSTGPVIGQIISSSPGAMV